MPNQCPACNTALLREEVATGYCPFCNKPLDAATSAGTTPSILVDGVVCPACNKPSDSVKCYRMGFFVFIFVAWFMQTKNEVGCPSCIRGKIAQFCAINLITANLLWPIIILPWTFIMLMCSLTKGHSKAVRDLLR